VPYRRACCVSKNDSKETLGGSRLATCTSGDSTVALIDTKTPSTPGTFTRELGMLPRAYS
jgi:hypothetical protein